MNLKYVSALLCLANPSEASDCAHFLFWCQIQNSADQVILCEQEDQTFYYAFGADNNPELQLTRTRDQLTYVPWDGIGKTEWATVSLESNDFIYIMNFTADRQTYEVSGDVTIFEVKTNRISRFHCNPDTLDHDLIDQSDYFAGTLTDQNLQSDFKHPAH